MQSAVGELAFLNLSNNRLHTFHIAGAGVVLPSLAVLDLSGNLLDEFAALDQLPSLEHLHLARNPRIHLIAPSRAHSALVQLDIANCSLRHMPDLSRLVALRELNVRGNRLHTIPAHWLPSEVWRTNKQKTSGEFVVDWSTDEEEDKRVCVMDMWEDGNSRNQSTE